jgi:hypothetical protein
LIAPEVILVRQVSSKVCLRCVQTRHAFVRSLANSVTHERAQCQSERLCRNGQNPIQWASRPRTNRAMPPTEQPNQIQNP